MDNSYTIPPCPTCGSDEVEADMDAGSPKDGMLVWFCAGCNSDWEDESENAHAYIRACAEAGY